MIIGSGSNFNLNLVDNSNEGKYSCTAENGQKVIESEFNISIFGMISS